MKTLTQLLTIALFTLSSFCLQAQLQVGGLLGVNLASISVDPEPSTEDYTGLLGLCIGGVLDYSFTENAGIRIELELLGKGAKIEEFGDKVDFALSYLELPILFRYSFDAGGVKPYLLVGPSVGFLVGAKIKADGNEFDIKDDTEGIDFSVAFGGGLSIPQDGFNPFVQIRYMLGLTNVNVDEDLSEVKNRGLQIQVGVLVPLQ